ncbi:arrestin homolog [Tachypleus tridentatus]|uniref:arrestin homolog n=1 Tax=Tachypleus tridentatus TaxID=6853 RepID=UPI003FD34260
MPSTVYKKQSTNTKVTLYLSSREIIVENNTVSPIDGVVLIDPSYVKERKVFSLIILTFRYGREDEEVMGLKFYTEAVLDFKQVYPPPEPLDHDKLSLLQRNLLRRLGNDAYPLTMRVSNLSPASVRLQPARAYSGSPLGISYELKVFPEITRREIWRTCRSFHGPNLANPSPLKFSVEMRANVRSKVEGSSIQLKVSDKPDLKWQVVLCHYV